MSIRLQRGFHSSKKLKSPIIATIGNFDGVHLGHQSLLSQVVIKRNTLGAGSAVAISFYPHPAVALGRIDRIPKITTLGQKLAAMQRIGIDHLILIHFTQRFYNLSASQFVDQVLLESIHVDGVVLGPDGTVGKNREGNVKFLSDYLTSKGKSAEIAQFLICGGERVSSRQIRDLIALGDVERASVLLGRSYEIEGRVIHGDGRGAKLGTPTANIICFEQVLPKLGVYISSINSPQGMFPAVTNIGTRPTFGGEKVLIESFILSGNQHELYGQKIGVCLHRRIRDEIKFENAAELKSRIALDVAEAKSWHASRN